MATDPLVTIFVISSKGDPENRGRAVLKALQDSPADFNARAWIGDAKGLDGFPDSAYAAVVAGDGDRLRALLIAFEPREIQAREYVVVAWRWPCSERGELALRNGIRTPGVSMLSLIAPRADIAHDRNEAIKRWRLHIPVAHRLHFRMIRYVQYELLDGLQGNPPFFGLAQLHYPTAEAMAAELNRSPQDTEYLMADVARFVNYEAARSVWATEYVFSIAP